MRLGTQNYTTIANLLLVAIDSLHLQKSLFKNFAGYKEQIVSINSRIAEAEILHSKIKQYLEGIGQGETPMNPRYYTGKVCPQHADSQGLRYKVSRKCVMCAREKASDRKRAAKAQRRVAPFSDYAGNEIYEGDTIRHPNGETAKVVYVSALDQPFRADYDDGLLSDLSLQVGDKGQAIKVNK